MNNRRKNPDGNLLSRSRKHSLKKNFWTFYRSKDPADHNLLVGEVAAKKNSLPMEMTLEEEVLEA